MTYSIIETRNDEVVSTHQTRKQAEDTLHEMTHVREYINGRYETKTTTAALHHRVRNDSTGEWIEIEDMTAEVPQADAAELRKLIEQGGYSQRSAARELQISERMMRYYCSGEQPVPRVVMLAMKHLVTCPP